MREVRWLLLVVALCLPVGLLVFQVWKPWAGGGPAAVPLSVPAGDQEIAWLHTTTNAATWERFVAGVKRLDGTVPGLDVDDSRAFLESTTGVPELVLSRAGHAGHVRIRWYKLQSEVSTADWVKALAARKPAPVAVIGGGSTDRAIQLAEAMAAQEPWQGDRPPLLITTATADFDSDGEGKRRLVDVYDDRTFRFCFSNRQMADAVVDFVSGRADLKPLPPPNAPDRVLAVQWVDDQFSVDLKDQFREAVRARADGHAATFDQWDIQFSVGGLAAANVFETNTAANVGERLRTVADARVLLVLPSTTQPARRLLRAVVDADPTAAKKLVVVTGDGLPLNAILRDGEFAWPVAALPVPLVFFAHANPVAWTADRFRPPNGTEEEMHFGVLGEVLAGACFPPSQPTADRGGDLIARLKARTDFFNTNGERNANSGEHVVLVRPGTPAELTVWRRAGGGWEKVPGTPVPVPYREDRP